MSNLTLKQQQLANELLTTEVDGKVIRRSENADGIYSFEHIERKINVVAFPVHPGEFAIKVHEKNPAAPLSPIFINLRHLPEELLTTIAETMNEIPQETQADYCTGIPNAGLPLAKKYSEISKIPFVDILDKTGTATDRKIEPKAKAEQKDGAKLIIVDDLVSQANTKLEAITAAETLGYQVIGIVVLIDREQGGKEALEQSGYKVYSALTISQILDYYLESGKISQDKYNNIKNYLSPNK